MNNKLTYHGEVRPNGLHIFSRKIMDEQLQSMLAGKEVILTIERKRNKRSNPQNRYYWSCIIPIIRQGMYDTQGEVFTPEEAHEFLKVNFNSRQLVNENGGDVLSLPVSTTRLSTIEFEEYLDRVRTFADAFFNVKIPLPNEQSEIAL